MSTKRKRSEALFEFLVSEDSSVRGTRQWRVPIENGLALAPVLAPPATKRERAEALFEFLVSEAGLEPARPFG